MTAPHKHARLLKRHLGYAMKFSTGYDQAYGLAVGLFHADGITTEEYQVYTSLLNRAREYKGLNEAWAEIEHMFGSVDLANGDAP